jgi:hypothetical protein
VLLAAAYLIFLGIYILPATLPHTSCCLSRQLDPVSAGVPFLSGVDGFIGVSGASSLMCFRFSTLFLGKLIPSQGEPAGLYPSPRRWVYFFLSGAADWRISSWQVVV